MSELPRSAFRFDPELVSAFLQDRLDDAGRAMLADEVARILPFHPQLPHPVIADLIALTGHLGGDEALLRWLDGYPGRPRVTARLFRVITLLDRWSAVPGVVLALEQRRARDPYPHALAGTWSQTPPRAHWPAWASSSSPGSPTTGWTRRDAWPCGRSRCSRTSPPQRRNSTGKRQSSSMTCGFCGIWSLRWQSVAPTTQGAADARRPRADHRRGAVRRAMGRGRVSHPVSPDEAAATARPATPEQVRSDSRRE
jgi:hypothetical protein